MDGWWLQALPGEGQGGQGAGAHSLSPRWLARRRSGQGRLPALAVPRERWPTAAGPRSLFPGEGWVSGKGGQGWGAAPLCRALCRAPGLVRVASLDQGGVRVIQGYTIVTRSLKQWYP
jgi:hypothetical protein